MVYADGVTDKSDRAKSIVGHAAAVRCIVPIQVLGEFANVSRKKLRTPEPIIRNRLNAFAALFGTPSTETEHLHLALSLIERFKCAFFDAVICAVSRAAGATHLHVGGHA